MSWHILKEEIALNSFEWIYQKIGNDILKLKKKEKRKKKEKHNEDKKLQKKINGVMKETFDFVYLHTWELQQNGL